MDQTQLLALLMEGEMHVEGRISWGSNATMLGHVCQEAEEIDVIYKPRRGERPLWDFPTGTLCNRERAAYLISEACGWSLVPLTVLREGPYGYGSVQLFVAHDPELHYFNLQGMPGFDDQLQKIVLLDWVINNADRKAGHVLLADDDKLWAIDHGICFHSEYKLRSVIWEYAGQPIAGGQRLALQQLEQCIESDLQDELRSLLTTREIKAMQQRLRTLLKRDRYPEPGPGRHYPWPPV